MPCILFHQDFVVPRHINYIIVQCSRNGSQIVLQQDAFTFIQVSPTDNNTKPEKPEKTTDISAKRKISLLLIGIDSLSRINLRRTMPRTVDYLKSNNWFELKGYNKVLRIKIVVLFLALTGLTAQYKLPILYILFRALF